MFTHLRGRYAIQQRSVRFFLTIIDGLLSWLIRPQKKRWYSSPKSILLILRGHLGDAVLLTALFEPLQTSFPKAKIGVVTGSWNAPVLKGHPAISTLHIYDYWRHNRGCHHLIKKWWRQLVTGWRSLREIRQSGYRVAVVLSPFFGNGVLFSYLSGIAQRIGYDCGGFGALLSHPVSGPRSIVHITQYHLKLLQEIDGFGTFHELQPNLPQPKRADLLKEISSQFVVINMGAGEDFKKWPLDKWRELVAFFQKQGLCVVITGRGALEADAVDKLLKELPSKRRIINLCNSISWDTFASIVEAAELLVCHDSVSGHLASCFSVPTIALFSGVRSAILNFYPLNKKAICLCKSLPCNPCFMVEKGCASMACISEIQVDEVIEAACQLVGEIFDSKRKFSIL